MKRRILGNYIIEDTRDTLKCPYCKKETEIEVTFVSDISTNRLVEAYPKDNAKCVHCGKIIPHDFYVKFLKMANKKLGTI